MQLCLLMSSLSDTYFNLSVPVLIKGSELLLRLEQRVRGEE